MQAAVEPVPIVTMLDSSATQIVPLPPVDHPASIALAPSASASVPAIVTIMQQPPIPSPSRSVSFVGNSSEYRLCIDNGLRRSSRLIKAVHPTAQVAVISNCDFIIADYKMKYPVAPDAHFVTAKAGPVVCKQTIKCG